ncbi:hypothetical protein MMC18_005964 [Xylographa bjoerkii]|nr:hypothetical protein [Xylographa bjoerkii]
MSTSGPSIAAYETANLAAMPFEILNEIMGYLIPVRICVHLRPKPLVSTRKPDAKIVGNIYHGEDSTLSIELGLAGTCHSLSDLFTVKFYKNAAFCVDNSSASITAGANFLLNLRPTTAEYIPKFFVYYRLGREAGREVHWSRDKFEEDNKTARKLFYRALSLTHLQKLQIDGERSRRKSNREDTLELFDSFVFDAIKWLSNVQEIDIGCGDEGVCGSSDIIRAWMIRLYVSSRFSNRDYLDDYYGDQYLSMQEGHDRLA